MELWIRSQDRERLMKATDIRVAYLEHIGWLIEDCDELGRYKSKERALQILDEIQNILQPRIIMKEPEIDYDDMINSLTDNIVLKTTQKIDMELKEAGQVVYQMPEE